MIAAITMLDGVSLKSRPANRRSVALPWAHAFDCHCEAHQTFTCDRCGRRVGYCLGASDNMPEACDFCWREEEVDRG